MAMGTVKVEALESVDGVTYKEEATDLKTAMATGVALVQYTAKPGVRYVKFKITEENVGPASVSCVAGIK